MHIETSRQRQKKWACWRALERKERKKVGGGKWLKIAKMSHRYHLVFKTAQDQK